MRNALAVFTLRQGLGTEADEITQALAVRTVGQQPTGCAQRIRHLKILGEAVTSVSGRHARQCNTAVRAVVLHRRPASIRGCRVDATVYAMPRIRISATVDGNRLARVRTLTGARDSQLLDLALAALLSELEAERERGALERDPYDADPALAWEAPPGPDLPYDGDIPSEVLALAARRRDQR